MLSIIVLDFVFLDWEGFWTGRVPGLSFWLLVGFWFSYCFEGFFLVLVFGLGRFLVLVLGVGFWFSVWSHFA